MGSKAAKAPACWVAAPALAATALSAITCVHNPYSWDDIVCPSKIPSTIEGAKVEGLTRLREAGAIITYSNKTRQDAAADVFWNRSSCEVVLYANWTSGVGAATVPWHELVHCTQRHWGQKHTREFPALRQDVQVLRAIGRDEDDIVSWGELILDHHGWLSDEELALLLEPCPEDENYVRLAQ